MTSTPASAPFPDELLAELVDATGGSYDVSEIERVNGALESWLTEHGWSVSRHPVEDRADLLVAELAVGPEAGASVHRSAEAAGSSLTGSAIADSAPAGPVVTLVGHSDTVWPAGFDETWRLDFDDATGTISGPGVGDMKAALVMAGLAGLEAAGRSKGRGLVRLLVVPDEEVGSVGSLHWIEHYAADSDLCIGLEAGKPDGGFVFSRGAVGAMRVHAEGNAVHVTEPGGINALDAILHLAPAVRELSDESALVSVCHLEAGSSRQITAARGMFEVDLRADDATDLEAAVAGIRALVDGGAPGFAGRTRWAGGLTRPAFPAGLSEEPRRMLAEIDEAAGRDPAHGVHERGGSDASFFAAQGVPTIDGFGPACVGNCTREESITRASIADRTERMARLIASWIDQGKRRDR